MHAVSLVADAGFDTVEASNADEAIAILEARKDIRIVFTDINMPGSMDGLRLAHAIRRRWPPIELILTSGDFQVAEEELPPVFGRISEGRVKRTKMADTLCQKVSEYHALLQDEDAKVQFRRDYKALIETKKLPSVMGRTTVRSRMLNQMIDHAKNLEKVEAIGEKLNRELGDF
jgi:CheY-like chemotaxis protein